MELQYVDFYFLYVRKSKCENKIKTNFSFLSLLLFFFLSDFLACPVNFLAAQPRYGTAVALVCWMILQIIILFTQDFLGPRFFIPKRFLPPKYDYKRPLSLAPEESSDCVICMSPVDLRQRDYMVTPCDHIFHELCLLQWLEQQQNCPTCRRQLPNI